MKTLLLAGILWGLAVGAQAQETAKPTPLPVLPPGPALQRRAPDRAQWVIKQTVAPTPDAELAKGGATDKHPKSYWGSLVAVTKTGSIMLRQTIDDKGQTWNTWCTPDLQTTIYPDGQHWIVQSISPDPKVPAANYEDYSKTDFPGLEWVTLDKYVDLKEINGKRCIIFKSRFKMADDDPAPTDFEADVDLDTRYPVETKVGANLRTYTFSDAPPAMLSLPPLVLSLLDNRAKMMSSATRRMPGH